MLVGTSLPGVERKTRQRPAYAALNGGGMLLSEPVVMPHVGGIVYALGATVPYGCSVSGQPERIAAVTTEDPTVSCSLPTPLHTHTGPAFTAPRSLP